MNTSNSDKPFEGYGHGNQKVRGIITAEDIGLEAGGIVYRHGKAKMLNVLVAALEPTPKLHANKRIVEDILANIARDVKEYIVSILGEDFHVDVETDADAVLSGKERDSAEAEHRELKAKLR